MMANPHNPLLPPRSLRTTWATPPTKKRKAFFSFNFADIMRVNNVRNAWKIDHPDNALMRSFYDSSLWESRKLEGSDAIKRLIREGVEQTSTVCVLIGTATWSRRWVRYEMARAVIDNRGLVGVHINGINHHVRRRPCPLGPNPLDFLGIIKTKMNGVLPPTYQLAELTAHGWALYQDYTWSVQLPPYLPDPSLGHVVPLSWGCRVHNFCLEEGHKNIGSWIDAAARVVGR